MKKIITFILCLVMCLPFMVNAVEIKPYFQASFAGSEYDTFYNAVETKDGGIVAVGYTESTDLDGLINNGNIDGFIVKYDKNGDVLWKSIWGGNAREDFYSIAEMDNGNLVVVGTSRSTNIEGLVNFGNSDAIFIIYDKDGNLLSQKKMGGTSSDSFSDVLILNDNEFILIGTSKSSEFLGSDSNGDSDTFILKLDIEGNVKWINSFGGNKYDGFTKVKKTSDNGFVVIGYSMSTDIMDNGSGRFSLILKYDENGNSVWINSWGNAPQGYSSYFKDVVELSDGYIAVGSGNRELDGKYSSNGMNSTLIKYDKNGNIIWEKLWGGSKEDFFNQIIECDDNTLLVVGGTSSENIDGYTLKGFQDICLLRYNKDGNVIWYSCFGGNSSDSSYKLFYNDNVIKFVGNTLSSNLENVEIKGDVESFIVYADLIYNFNLVNDSIKGNVDIKQLGSTGVITPLANDGYEVDSIFVKDSIGNIVNVIKLEDGTYSFPLYTDVSVEVLFKEILTNPKTGVFNPIIFIPAIMVLGMCVYFIKSCEKSYEL